MKKKNIVTILTASILTAPILLPTQAAGQSDRLRELQQEQNELDNQSQELDSQIQDSEREMDNLQEERSQLESEVTILQETIDETVTKIQETQEEIERIEKEIERLQEEIERLEEQIERRNAQLEEQARSVQTHGNPTQIIDLLLSAESLSDLIGRIGVVSELVSANQSEMQAQIDDQKQLEQAETQVQEEQEEVEVAKQQLEIERNNLVAQRAELDDKIVQVAEAYNMTAEERESFQNEQRLIAQRISTLSQEMQEEQERIIAEERRRQEEEERRQEEQRLAQQREAEEAAARERAERERAATSSSGSAEAADSSSGSNGGNSGNSGSNGGNSGSNQSSGWTRPASGRLSSHYGYRTHPITGDRRFHAGIDIAGGGPIVAARGGTVTTATYNSGYGYYVVVDHGDGYSTLYAHMQPNLSVAPGQQVSQGQQLGIMGTTGQSTGVHLHFEVHRNGSTVNPINYIGG